METEKQTPSLPKLDRTRTALVVTDPQNDFLKEGGVAYGLFADNLREVGTVDNIDRLLKAAKRSEVLVVISPHVYFPSDSDWKAPGALVKQMLSMGVLRRAGPASPKGPGPSGADFLERYKAIILDGETIVVSPHKVYGPNSNDLLLQLRSRGIDTVILGGLAANLCTDSHLRELVENGFRVFVVKDAVAAPGSDSYRAALVNCAFIANGVLTTDEAVAMLAN